MEQPQHFRHTTAAARSRRSYGSGAAPPPPARHRRIARGAPPLLLLLLAVLVAACGADILPREPLAERDLPEIAAHDTLVVLSPYNSTSYFIYRGEPMGFEFELLEAFARSRDLALRVDVVYDPDSMFRLLESGAADVVAGRLVPDTASDWRVAYAPALYTTQAALVQRDGPPSTLDLPEAVDTIVSQSDAPSYTVTPVTLRARLITQPEQLAGDSIWLPWRSPFRATLLELEDSITGEITIVEAEDSVSHESLIRRVARGEIDLTVSPENVAKLRTSYFTNVVVLPTVGPPRPVVWAVRENAPQLQAALAAFLQDSATAQLRDQLYERYFIDRRGYRERVASAYLASETGRLSQYDSLFKRYAGELGWDWRLLASQSFQESRFLATARSWAGAVGLLQLMPATARSVGVTNPRDPEQNVRGAVRFIQDLERFWVREITDPAERLKFVLASYNVGIGHVQDARRLTVKNGGNDQRWDDVAYWLLQKSKRAVYTDPVVKYGFARGLEPVTYVALVLERFEHYRQFVET